MTNWIKCSERMPVIGVDVLVFRTLNPQQAIKHFDGAHWFGPIYDADRPGEVTHWQPLPEPPNE